jgi:hypothetical protein
MQSIKAKVSTLFFLTFLMSVIVSAEDLTNIGEIIAESHIKANLVEQTDFERVLTRDLESYFSEIFETPVTVEFEMLRNIPTQSGVSLPKFYLWVILKNGQTTFEKGAVRVASINRKFFEITDFLSIDEIRLNPDKIYMIFPGPVCEKILSKVCN